MLVRPNFKQSWRVCAALFAMLAAASAHATDEARDWILRMNQALKTRSYEGVMVRKIGTKSVSCWRCD